MKSKLLRWGASALGAFLYLKWDWVVSWKAWGPVTLLSGGLIVAALYLMSQDYRNSRDGADSSLVGGLILPLVMIAVALWLLYYYQSAVAPSPYGGLKKYA